MNRDRRVRSLRRALRRWMPRSSWVLRIDAEVLDRVDADLVIEVDGEPSVRVGYALTEMLIAAGKWLECIDVSEICWPNDESGWVGEQRRLLRAELASGLDRYQRLLGGSFGDRPDVIRILMDFDIDDTDPFSCLEADDPVDATLLLVARYREEKALEIAFRSMNLRYSADFTGQLENTVNDPFRALSDIDREALGWAITNYRASEWIYPWMRDERFKDGLGTYPLMSSLPSIQQEIAMQKFKEIMPAVIDVLPGNYEDYDNLESIIDRVTRAISELGYDEFADSVIAHGGQSGGRSLLGNTGPVNLIPSSGSGSCCPTVVAVARGSRDTKRGNGIRQLMRSLRAHLIDCLHKTQVALILTDTVDPLISESREDLLAHGRRGVAVIVLHVVGNTINLIDLGS